MLFTEKALGHYSRYDRYHTTVTTVMTVTYGHRTLVPGSPTVVPQRISSKFMRNLGALGAKPAKEIWVASERNSGLGQASAHETLRRQSTETRSDAAARALCLPDCRSTASGEAPLVGPTVTL